MPSNEHQFIMGLVIKKMQDEGCKIAAIEGRYPGLLCETRPLPPQVTRHRPDAIGIGQGQRIYIGEAKTANDVTSRRTREQLNDFTSVQVNGNYCQVWVGLPESSRGAFDRMLRDEGLDQCENLQVLYIPDVIINE